MEENSNVCSPWVVSPELALVVIEAEGSTASSVSNLDALRCVQVVPGVLRVLLNSTICESCFLAQQQIENDND